MLGRILGLNGHLGISAMQGPLTDYAAAAARIRALPQVERAAPVVEGQVLLTTDAGGRPAASSAASRRRISAPAPIIAGNIRAGDLAAFQGEDAIVIGAGLAGSSRSASATASPLVSPQGRVTVFGTVPRLRAYRVAAVFEVGMQEYDSGFVFLPLAAAQLFFQLPQRRQPDRGPSAQPRRLATPPPMPSARRCPNGRCASPTGRTPIAASSSSCRSSATSCS